MTRLLLCVFFATSLFAQDGAALYKTRCAVCHDAAVGRVPPFSALRSMDGKSISTALETGSMKTQAEGLTGQQRALLIAFLTADARAPTPSGDSNYCPASKGAPWNVSPLAGWTSWGVTPENTRFQDAKAAGLTAADLPRLKLKYAFGLGEGIVARAQPAIAGGRVFFGTAQGLVYSIDARSGCTYWSFQAENPIRSSVVLADSSGQLVTYVADQKTNVYALEAASGKLMWKSHADDHFAALITGSPQCYQGVLYVPVSSFEEVLPQSPKYECCTFRGSIVAFDAATGTQLWKTYTIAQSAQPTEKSSAGVQLHGPSGAGVWSTPTIDKKSDLVYIATGDNYSDPPTSSSDAVIALDRNTGKVVWSKQITPNDAYNNACNVKASPNCPHSGGGDFDFGQSPILVALSNGHRALVIGQKSGMVHALDPDQKGEILWHTKAGEGGTLGGIMWGSAVDRDNMYVAVSDLRLTAAADPSSPAGFTLDADPHQGGGILALRLIDGQQVWRAKPSVCGDRKHCSPAQSAAVTAVGGVAFSGSIDGHLRAYSASTGEVIWDVDTVGNYETVNRLKAQGGSIDVAGPVIAGGMIFVNSGYGQWGGLPGNVLLAYSVDGR